MFGLFKAKGATRDEIRALYTDKVNKLASEPVGKLIRVGSTILPLQKTTAYFISMNMKLLVSVNESSIEDSFARALGTLALFSEPDEDMQASGKTLFDSAVFSHHEHLAKNRREAEKQLSKFRAIADFRIQVEGIDLLRWSRESITTDLHRMSMRLIQEKPFKHINVGPIGIKLKSADLYFLAILMAFQINERNQSREKAFEYALVLRSMMSDGVELHRASAGIEFKRAIEWNLGRLETDFLAADGVIINLWKFVMDRIDAADGIDLRKSS